MPLLVVSLCLSSLLLFDEPAPPDRQSLAPEVARELEMSASTDPEVRKRGLDLLLGRGDADLLGLLAPLLELEDESTRRDVTLAVLSRAPADAADFFISALSPGSLPRREAAAHGLGRTGDARTVSTLLPFLTDDEPRLREASLRGLISVIRSLVGGALSRATGRPVSRKPVDAARLEEVRQALLGASREGSPAPELSALLRRIANHSTAVSLVERFCRSLPEEKSSLARALPRLQAKNRRWLGRPVPIDRGFNYTFVMENRVAGSVKEVPIAGIALDIDDLRFWGYDLDRVCRLRFASDLLALDPGSCAPILSESEGQPSTIRLKIPERELFRSGVGILNIAYWEGVISGGSIAVVSLDPSRSRPLSESIFDGAGKLLAKSTFSDWIELPDESFAPGTIVTELFSCTIGGSLRHLVFSCTFQVVEGMWFLLNAETEEILADGAVLRALGSIDSVSLSPIPDRGPQSDGDEEGESSSESRGQGTAAGSPRR